MRNGNSRSLAPLPLVARMEIGDPNDPLLRQVLPIAAENQSPDHYSIDPLAELGATLQPGLLQKYNGRVLMIVTGACAVHCRYCFRRHFPYQESPSSPSQWAPAIEQIASDDSIEEVILERWRSADIGRQPACSVDQPTQCDPASKTIESSHSFANHDSAAGDR